MRQLGHAFVATTLSDGQLDQLAHRLDELLVEMDQGSARVREFSRERFADFVRTFPADDQSMTHYAFADSIVAGGANPLGLAARLWREDQMAVMEVTLGAAFEGAPGRAHGGVVAALLDEVMGLGNVVRGEMAYTAQLDITYHAPTPLGQPIIARSWLERRDGRKRFVVGEIHAEDVLLASAKGLFLAVDRAVLLGQSSTSES